MKVNLKVFCFFLCYNLDVIRMKKKISFTSIIILVIASAFVYYNDIGLYEKDIPTVPNVENVLNVPDYNGVDKYVVINNNEPFFLSDDLVNYSYEFYSDLDDLGRCGVAMANIGVDLMPSEDRGEIGAIKPSGWHTIKYDFISGKYLYNRCHLIGYQLTGENANDKNLITCTRSTNIGIMLEYENKVANYIKETNNHVLYRVTPIFKDDNLLASGIEMEALSIEDQGEGIKFNIYIYNVEDGVIIDYKSGDSKEGD